MGIDWQATGTWIVALLIGALWVLPSSVLGTRLFATILCIISSASLASMPPASSRWIFAVCLAGAAGSGIYLILWFWWLWKKHVKSSA